MPEKKELAECADGMYAVISSENYARDMKEKVESALDSLRNEFKVSVQGGIKLYGEYYLQPEDTGKGSVFLMHGYTESCDKYREVIFYMLSEGFNVMAFEHRGHGRSRAAYDTDTAHAPTDVEYFEDYVDDAERIIMFNMRRYMPGPYYLYAHSMGGAVGAACMQRLPKVFKKAVLNAPMLEINLGGVPKIAAQLLTSVVCMFGRERSFMPGQTAFSPDENFEASASNCIERYRYYFEIQKSHPEYRNGGAGYRWAREALSACDSILKKRYCRRIKTPVLLIQAGNDSFVLPGGQDKFADRVRDCRIVTVPDAKHEVYMSDDKTLALYWNVVFNFFSDK